MSWWARVRDSEWMAVANYKICGGCGENPPDDRFDHHACSAECEQLLADQRDW